MSELNLYELVTPLDDITFYAPDNDVAEVIALVVGGGKAGLDRCDGEECPKTMFLFGGFTDEDGARIKRTFEERRQDCIVAAGSMAVCSKGYREEYDLLTKNSTDEDAILKWDDRHRSSMSDWAGYSRKLAKLWKEVPL